MNEDIKDMLLDLEDEGYTVKYNKRDTGANIKYKRNFKLREVKHIVQRLFDYNQGKNFYLQITTKNRIVGGQNLKRKFRDKDTEFCYNVYMDTELFDSLYIKRGRYSDVPLYIKNGTEIKEISFSIL